jgi:hypothetical protein
METPYTDQDRIDELDENVRAYVDWVEKVDSDLREHFQKIPLRIKNVNRHMVTTPVY